MLPVAGHQVLRHGSSDFILRHRLQLIIRRCFRIGGRFEENGRVATRRFVVFESESRWQICQCTNCAVLADGHPRGDNATLTKGDVIAHRDRTKANSFVRHHGGVEDVMLSHVRLQTNKTNEKPYIRGKTEGKLKESVT